MHQVCCKNYTIGILDLKGLLPHFLCAFTLLQFIFHRFVGREKQKDWLRIFKGDDGACWSYLGKTGGEQPLSLGKGCPGTGVVTHEIMHTLGK